MVASLVLPGGPVDFLYDADGGIVRVTFQGDVDITRHLQVRDVLDLARNERRPTLIEFADTTQYIDSYSLGEVLMFRRKMEEDGCPVAIAVRDRNVYRIFDIVSDGRLAIFSDEEAALRSLAGRSHAFVVEGRS
jgi:anti-anti-sigma factor